MDHRLRKLDDGFHQIYSHTFAGRKEYVDGGLYLQQEQLQASAVPQARFQRKHPQEETSWRTNLELRNVQCLWRQESELGDIGQQGSEEPGHRKNHVHPGIEQEDLPPVPSVFQLHI